VDPTYWEEIVELFKKMRSPMRPDVSEADCFYRWVQERIEQAELPRDSTINVLLLGVTVELVELPWPDNVMLTAVDRSDAMIRAFWPGDIPGRRRLVRADWDDLPLAPSSFHFAIGDGVLNARSYPDDYRDFAAHVRSLLRPGGVFLLRAFTQLEQRENSGAIVAALRAGEITDYNELTFRILTSMQTSAVEGVTATKSFIDAELRRCGVDDDELYSRTGYVQPPASSHRPERMSGIAARVSYPTVREIEQVLAPMFEPLGRRYGTHSTAQRCPIFGLLRTGQDA